MINVGIKFPNDGDFCNHDVIFNELTYIFSYPTESHPERIPKPIHFYGVPNIGYPPQIDDLIRQFEHIRQYQSQTIPQQVWHFTLNFPELFKSIYNPYFIFADTIARLFCYEYPVCYAYHTKNKETGGHHSHFHYVVSTSSYISDHPALDADRLLTYLPKMQEIAWEYNLKLYHHQREEELQCLNLTTIF